jgi:Protein of unknown function (DUF3168)
MLEGQRVASLVFDLLKADTGAGGVNTLTGGRIYRDRVPQTALLPAVTVTLVSATDTNTLGGLRVFQNVLIDVRVVSDGTVYSNAIADRVDTVLQQASGLKETVHVNELRREQVMAFVEDDAGKSYAHIVSTYRSEAYA